jgi:Flp pilus assembly protein TadD
MDAARSSPWLPLFLTLLAVAAFVTYASTLGYGFIRWDDDGLVYENPLVTQVSPGAVAQAFTSYDPQLYVPLTILSYQAESLLFGVRPLPFHTTNVFLHVGCVLLAFGVLRRLGLREGTAFLGALLFAVHPLNAEAVAWISARKDLLASFFSLAAVYAYLSPKRKGIALVSVWLLLALLSKASAVAVPVIFLLMDWYRSGRLGITDLRRLLIPIGLAVLFLLIGLGGKAGVVAGVGLHDTVLLSFKSAAFGLRSLVFPVGLSAFYHQDTAPALSAPDILAAALLLLGLLCLTIRSLRATRAVAFALLWYLAFLLPSFSNFSRAGEIAFFSDRYAYLAQLGILFLLGWGLDRLRDRRLRDILFILGVCLCMTFGAAAHLRARTWADSDTFYKTTIAQNERSAVLRYNAGLILQERGLLDDALPLYQEAVARNPSFAKAWNNIGIISWQEGKPAESLPAYRKAVTASPSYAEAYNNMGVALRDLGRYAEAMDAFRQAITLAPGYLAAQRNAEEVQALMKGRHRK